MDIMGIEHIEFEGQYQRVLLEIRELAKSKPASDSEAADIINHLSTLASEWANSHPQHQDIIEYDKMDLPADNSLDNPSLFRILYIRMKELVL